MLLVKFQRLNLIKIYIFINTFNGYALITNGKIVKSRKKLWEINPNAKSVFKKELKAALTKGGGFIYYSWAKPDNPKKAVKKISFIYGMDQWRWIVGSGVYLDDINKTIAVMKNNLNIQTKKQLLLVLIFILSISIISIFIFYKISNKLSKDFNKLSSFLEKSAINDEKIDLNIIDFCEIKQMANSINNMIDSKQSLQNRYENEFITSFVHIMEARDIYTKGHSQRVAFYASKISDALKLDNTTKENIYRAGLLHDIGKIGIPDNILLKPGRLTKSEYNIIKYHSVFSYEILSRLEHFEHLARCVREHHERCDGKGYPDGLKCSEISLCGRILAIADIFDAITTTRPYRKAFDTKTAIEILEKENIDKEILEKSKDILVESFRRESSTEVIFMSKEISDVRNKVFDIDYMTGLKRKKTIVENAKHLIENNQPFALFMIDIKNIAKINYEFSVDAGDKIITLTADACSEILPRNGYDNTNSLARAFNDAFLFIHKLGNDNKNHSLDEMSRSIRNLLRDAVIELIQKEDIKGISNYIDFHITYAIFPYESSNINKLMNLCSLKKSQDK